MSRDFSKRHLLRLLTSGAVIRHDVDYDLGCAVRMAHLERLLGVRAIYCIRTDGVDYSLEDARRLSLDLGALGGIVALHPWLEVGRGAAVASGDLSEACFRSWAVLPGATRYVSFHAPPHDALWRKVPQFHHLMGPAWKDRYCSDSRGRFAVDPDEMLKRGRCQLNLHPEWWLLGRDAAQELREREAVAP